MNYGVDFPLFEKIEVNGEGQHPLYQQLNAVPDAEGHTGDIRWNFEKFLVSPEGEVVGRFNPTVEPRGPGARRRHRGADPQLAELPPRVRARSGVVPGSH